LAASQPASALLDNGVDPSHLGKGDWIWEMDQTESNLGVSTVQAVINFEKAEGMQFLIVKCADGGQYGPDYWPQFDSDLVTLCHAAGIKIFGFGYVYGSYYGSGQVQAEIDAAVACMGVTDSSGVPMDGFVIDAEIEYNGQSANAITYCQGIRAVYPTRCLAHSPYPIPSYNESFPYIEFGRYCDVVMPQDYWYDQFESSGGVTPQYMADLMNTDWIKWQNTWVGEGDGSSVKPLVPIGQGFQGDSPVAIPGSQLTSFYNELKSENPCATAGGYQGITFWVAQSHTTDMWNAIAAMTFVTPPVITNQPVSTTNCQGRTATFSVVAGPAPLNYQWRKNGGNLSGATVSSLALSAITTNDAASYAVVVTNSAGSITSAVATLTVTVAPAIVTQPQPQAVCQGGSATFTVTASGTPLTYQWQFNGANINGTLSSYTLNNVHTNKAGNYTVIVSNACGVVTSAVATLTVPLPPAIATQPQSQVVTQGSSAAFTVTAAAGTAPSYQWQFNGNNVNGTLSSYSLGNVHANKAGPYTVVLTNACNTLTSAVAWLTVVMPLASQTVTQGGSAIFTVANYGGDPSLACQWQKNGTNLTDGGEVSGSGTTNLILSGVSASDAASYAVEVTNGAGSNATVGATLTVLSPPPPCFNSISLLPGGAVGLSMSGTPGLSYDLECTSNWVDWVVLTNFTNSGGLFPYTDPAPTNTSSRFYRVRLRQ